MTSADARPQPASPQIPAHTKRWTVERVMDVRVWAPSLWSIRVSRPAGYVFTPGHYARLGLPVGSEEAVWRAYSVVSAPEEDVLEFLVTLVPGGALTGRLAAGGGGSEIMVEAGAMGFFIEGQLAPGETLWMLSTGSGVGPYVSMLREGGVTKRYRRIAVVHAVRHAAELAYADELAGMAQSSAGRLVYVPVVTREAGVSPLAARIPHLIESGALEAHVGERLDPAGARAMVCGNPDFTADMRRLLAARAFQPCRRGLVGSMLFENYW